MKTNYTGDSQTVFRVKSTYFFLLSLPPTTTETLKEDEGVKLRK